MSVSAAVARVQQIEAMIAAAQAGNPNPGTAPTGFDQQLAQATPAAATGTRAAAPSDGSQPAAGATGDAGPYRSMIDAAARKYNIDPALLEGLIKQESGFDPNSTSGAGAVGLTQLMPGTAAALGVSNPRDPAQSIDAGAHYLRQQLDAFGGDVRKALAAYNAGPGAVQQYGGVPPFAETQDYVRKVMGYADEYRRQSAGPHVLNGPTTLPAAA